MRLRLVHALVLVGLSVAAGCKGKDEGKAQAAKIDEGTAKAADDLLARRDALMKSRSEVADKMKALEIERTKIIEAGGDPSEVDKQAEELRSQKEQIDSEDSAVSGEMSALLEGVKSVQASGDAQERAAQREVIAKEREERAAAREKEVAMREKDIAEREKALGLREKDMCSGGGGGTTTIIQQVDPKGTKYSKKDVESSIKKARDAMSKKGLLSSDLPSQAAGLEKEATKAMADGDYGSARFAAQQLLATVEAQKIDRNFISSKINRLSAKMKGRTLDDAKQKEVDDLFREATAKYGDGDYSGANKKLNAIWRAID
jgi:hypothetical protein